MFNLLTNRWLAPDRLAVVLLPVAGLAAAAALLPLGVMRYDMAKHYIPWMEAVRAGGLASMSSEFADYSPPYIYLMYLASWLVPLVGEATAIKLINVPFIATLSVAIYQIVLHSSGSRRSAAIAAAIMWVAPTPLVNAFAWGQTDAIYTSFLTLFVLFAIRRSPVAAAWMFGVALAFKLQAIFLLPVLVYLVLAKRMRVAHLLFVPFAYLLMMVPAAIAGRPWLELITIYLGQLQTSSHLAIDAPNPWKIVGALALVNYETGLFIGVAAAGLAGLAIAVGSVRLEPNSRTIVLVAALSAAFMPYLLPTMHERYFFVADVMTLTLAWVIPCLWVTAPLFQIGSLLSYMGYFQLSVHGPAYGLLPVTLGVGMLALEYMRAQIRSSVSIRAVFPLRRWANDHVNLRYRPEHGPVRNVAR